MNERVATYLYDRNWPLGIFHVVAYYDDSDGFDPRAVHFYDVYDNNGICVNEGDPWHKMPTWQEVYDLYYLPSLRNK